MNSFESAPTNDTESLPGWEGDWRGGERPEGYRSATRRYEKLSRAGFSLTQALDKDFVSQHNELMRKGRTNKLTGEEVRELLELNAQYHEAMDKFIEENLY